ncbi:MAG: hypothetical protein GKR93_00540 [Gammaproteobacteria bacterium]|nr:hypothetical protein [Gammaproteobacteria bacterium]
MKILNTLLISGLMTFSVSSIAADYEERSEEINRILQERIEASIDPGKRGTHFRAEKRLSAEIQTEILKVSFHPELPAHRS